MVDNPTDQSCTTPTVAARAHIKQLGDKRNHICGTDLQTLQEANYAKWLAVIQDAWKFADADVLFQAAQIRYTPTEERHNIKLKAAVKTLIRKSLRDDIWSKHPVECLAFDSAIILREVVEVYSTNNEATCGGIEKQ